MLKLIERVLLIVLLLLMMLSQFFSSRCIILGGISAALTSNGIYCQMWVEKTPQYFPLRLLENPPDPILFPQYYNEAQG